MEVSVVTPTYNRRQFIPALIKIYANQTFPKEKMEWIIIDDGIDKVGDLFQAANIPNIRYIALEDKLRIGAKRNRLNEEARAPIIIAMDDDDYYPPDRIQTVVDTFLLNPRIDLIGSSKMYLYFVDNKKIYSTGPFAKNHATNGTMSWRKSYSDKHKYSEYVTKGEEQSFLDNYINPMIQLDPLKAILVMCHTDNTVDKSKMNLKETNYLLSDFVKDTDIYRFYMSL